MVRAATWRTLTSAIVLVMSCILIPDFASAQTCIRCPINANDTAIGSAFGIFVNRNGQEINVSGRQVGVCETLILRANVQYASFGLSGGVGAGFTGGTGYILFPNGTSTNVTPADMAMTLVTTIAPDPNACVPPVGTTATPVKQMLDAFYSLTQADIGQRQFTFQFTNGTSLLPNQQNQCIDKVQVSPQINVTVIAAPTCSIAPPSSNVCAGATACFTATGTGPVDGQPYTIRWSGPNGFAQTNTGVLNSTICINNAQAVNAGVYTATVIDQFGCQSTCTATLVVNPNPTCSITPSSATNCVGGSTTFTVTMNSGTAPYTVVLSGCESRTVTIAAQNGSTNITHSCSAPGTCTLTANVTDALGCTGGPCSATHTCVPNPTCTITPPVVTNLIGESATFTVCVSSGTAPYTVVLSGCVNQTVVVAQQNGCTNITIPACTTLDSCTLTANVTDALGCTGGPCSATRYCTGTPDICVTKEVACFLGTNTSDCVTPRPWDPLSPGENCGPFGKTATGVKGDVQNPAFCYRIGVSNCGDLTLSNVKVIDDQYGDLTTNFTCIVNGTMAPGAHCEFTFKAEVGQNLTNIVVASGEHVVGNTTNKVSDVDNAVVHVIPAKINCRKEFSVDGGAWTNAYTFQDQSPHSVVWRVTVQNLGSVHLKDVSVIDASSNLVCNYSTVIPNLPVGGSETVLLCTNAEFVCTNREDLQNTVLVYADHYVSTNAQECICAYDIDGVRITVRSECSATIGCTFPNACRVTGGGRQDGPGLTCPDDVRYVTHGGQVGAPVGEETCELNTSLPTFWLGNPCIHGRWTHVRHYQGGVRGNFHARFFDTLKCICLGTEVLPDGSYPTNQITDGVCNKDDHKVAGPQPRPAPANKIVFTGVGDWDDDTSRKGKRASRAVLFRVDIEDRSEPGGSHPKGGVNPPDRYRIRIWILSDAEAARVNDPSDGYVSFRNAISACYGTGVRDGVDIPNSCGSGTITFPGSTEVRAPDIDDGGELERGNHQIHPMIKHCDPANPTGPGLANPKL